MSHIPASAMPHAKPTHDEADGEPAVGARETRADGKTGGGWGLAAALGGGALALGAIAAAAAVPLLKGRSAPKKERRERKAAKASAKSGAKSGAKAAGGAAAKKTDG